MSKAFIIDDLFELLASFDHAVEYFRVHFAAVTTSHFGFAPWYPSIWRIKENLRKRFQFSHQDFGCFNRPILRFLFFPLHQEMVEQEALASLLGPNQVVAYNDPRKTLECQKRSHAMGIFRFPPHRVPLVFWLFLHLCGLRRLAKSIANYGSRQFLPFRVPFGRHCHFTHRIKVISERQRMQHLSLIAKPIDDGNSAFKE
mmetsp:Transcript_17472/g.28352  ORF Transcript_17472/g.28352 Transcript_17472/m.28352 type:complete len:200 (-) Transcript_17472:322-921(-)